MQAASWFGIVTIGTQLVRSNPYYLVTIAIIGTYVQAAVWTLHSGANAAVGTVKHFFFFNHCVLFVQYEDL